MKQGKRIKNPITIFASPRIVFQYFQPHLMLPGTPTPTLFLFFRRGGLVIPEPDCRQAGGNPGSFHSAPRKKMTHPDNAVVSEGVPEPDCRQAVGLRDDKVAGRKKEGGRGCECECECTPLHTLSGSIDGSSSYTHLYKKFEQ